MSGTPAPVGPVTAGAARRARRRVVVSTVIDATGSGLWMPFAVLFLVHGRGLPLVESGAALTVGGLLGLASVPLVGGITDRLGLVPALMTSNALRCGCFLCYPLVSTGWQVVAVSAVVGVGDRLFWTVNAPLVDAISAGREADRLIGTQTIARFVGAGLGAAATAVLPFVAGEMMYDLLAVANAGSFAVAGLLLVGLVVPEPPARAARGVPAPRAGWRALLRHRAYVAFCAVHVLFALASVSKFTVLPVVVFDVLRGPQWLPGAAIAISTAVIVLGQQPVIAWFARWSRGTGLLVSAALFTAAYLCLAILTALPTAAVLAAVLLFSVLASLAEAIFAPATTAAAAATAPPELRGRASALFQLSWGIAQVIAPVVLTSLLGVGNAALWLVLAALCALTVPAVLRLRTALPAGVLT